MATSIVAIALDAVVTCEGLKAVDSAKSSKDEELIDSVRSS
jgi:hypothetical protein